MMFKQITGKFDQLKTISYKIYNNYDRDVKKLVLKSSSNIYKQFCELMKCEIEEIAIFYNQQLVKMKDEFKHYGNNEGIYYIYSIYTMKMQLEKYEDVQYHMNEYLKKLEQETHELKLSLHESQSQLSRYQESEQQLYLSKLDELQNNIRNSIFQSKFEEISYNCQSCQMLIYGTNIQTPCYHNYHQQCFEELIEKQNHDIKIQCLCNKKLSFKILQNHSDKDKIQQLQEQIYSNQLKVLKEKLKQNYLIGEYQNEDWPYFYIIKAKNSIEQQAS